MLFVKILNIIQIVIYIYLGLATLYIFIFSFAGLFKYKNKASKDSIKRKFAVLIPGYKEDKVIVKVAQDALNQDYPQSLYDVIVIADSFKSRTLEKLAKLPVKVIEVSFKSSTKSKALNKAMEQLSDDYDAAIVLDADNLMAKDFIKKINKAFSAGFIAIQGHRIAKNTDTHFAILDAVSEEINNHIFRKGHRVLGLSSAIIGSGMAFEYKFFKNLMKTVKAVGGFDKELELKILKKRKKIEYLEDAYIYDEKVQKSEVFSKQRRRWLSAQFHYLRKDFLTSVWHLISKGNIDYFDKAFQFLQAPRILLIGLLTLITILSILLNPISYTYAWLVILILCILAFIFSVPVKFYNLKTLNAILTLPKGFVLMFISLIKIRGANKKFIHTGHSG